VVRPGRHRDDKQLSSQSSQGGQEADTGRNRGDYGEEPGEAARITINDFEEALLREGGSRIQDEDSSGLQWEGRTDGPQARAGRCMAG
jgi:hypothetical protein